MTREEQISNGFTEMMKGFWGNQDLKVPDFEEPCKQEPCDDCISRQAAIEVLRNRWLKTRNYEGIGEDIAEECEIYLKTLPSAQPEKVCIANITLSEEQIREAVEKALESNRENVRATLRDDHGSYRCTNCNALISDEIDYVLEDYKPIQFCPNCGAYMRGDSDE